MRQESIDQTMSIWLGTQFTQSYKQQTENEENIQMFLALHGSHTLGFWKLISNWLRVHC